MRYDHPDSQWFVTYTTCTLQLKIKTYDTFHNCRYFNIMKYLVIVHSTIQHNNTIIYMVIIWYYFANENFSSIKRCSDTYRFTIGVKGNSFLIIIHLSTALILCGFPLSTCMVISCVIPSGAVRNRFSKF